MPKYYVESGSVQMIVQAHHGRGAALWAVHRAMSQVLPFLCEAAGESEKSTQRVQLGESIQVNEQGFGRTDGRRFETFDVAIEWNQLMVALSRLERDLMTTAV